MSAATSPPRNRQCAMIHLYEDRDGKVHFSAHFEPPIADIDAPGHVPGEVEAVMLKLMRAAEDAGARSF